MTFTWDRRRRCNLRSQGKGFKLVHWQFEVSPDERLPSLGESALINKGTVPLELGGRPPPLPLCPLPKE
eukprot:8396690-Lingulodinium_polyedra.AAC.1